MMIVMVAKDDDDDDSDGIAAAATERSCQLDELCFIMLPPRGPNIYHSQLFHSLTS